MAVSYNTHERHIAAIFKATSGGTVFGSNLTTSTAVDLFDDTAVVDDAIYFGNVRSNAMQSDGAGHISDIILNIGTAMAGTGIELAWEYLASTIEAGYPQYNWIPTELQQPSGSQVVKWCSIVDLQDDTAGFTVTCANRVKFPLQYNPFYTTINGFTNYWWVRCRIKALTTITEGGATQTSRIKSSNGIVTVSGSTEASPESFMNIANHLNASYPYITGIKGGHCFYNFSKVAINITTPLKTRNEVIELGHGIRDTNMPTYLNYLISGTKLSDYAGKDGSVFLINGVSNTYPIYGMTSTKAYGSVFKSLQYGSNSGYYQINGANTENIDNIHEHNTSVQASGKNNNNKYRWDFCINGQVWANGVNNELVLVTNSIGIVYAPHDFYNWTFNYVSTFIGNFCSQYYTTPQSIPFNFYDCLNYPRNALKPANVSNGNPYLSSIDNYSRDYSGNDLNSCFFYDSTAGTFTDYTTASKPTDAGTVPLYGEVGDMIYFRRTGLVNTMIVTVPSGSQANDYEYDFECYTQYACSVSGSPANSWVKIGTYKPNSSNAVSTRVTDKTDNFTKDGNIFLVNLYRTTEVLQTINGVSGYWVRIKITKKGTTTPVLKGLRCGLDGGVNAEFRFWFSFVYKVVDVESNALQGATVIIKDKDGNVVLTKTTDVGGLSEKTYVMIDRYYYDEVNADRTGVNLTNNEIQRFADRIYELKSPFEIYITKTGYETYYIKKDITAKVNETIALKKAVPLLIGVNTGKDYLKLNPDNLNSREIIID